jgi:hypothetical protein
LPENRWHAAKTNNWAVPSTLSGSPKVGVRSSSGESTEGILVQLIERNHSCDCVVPGLQREANRPNSTVGMSWDIPISKRRFLSVESISQNTIDVRPALCYVSVNEWSGSFENIMNAV